MYSEIASNKRRSVIFVRVFFVIWMAIGALCGLVYKSFAETPNRYTGVVAHVGVAPIIAGVVIAGILAFFGFLYAVTSGSKLILRVSGAQPADPIQYQRLHGLVETLALGEGIPKPAIYVINDPSPNAFATGVSPGKAAITYTSGLLQMMNREELEGVTSHEMSHIKNHDIRLLLIVGTLIGMAALLASIFWRGAFFSRGGDKNGGPLLIVMLVAALLLTIVGFVIGPLIRLALSRRRESLADVSGVELTRNPAGLISALRKLQQNDKPFAKFNHATSAMCIDDPLQHHGSWFHRLYDTHPPIEDRIAALEAILQGKTV